MKNFKTLTLVAALLASAGFAHAAGVEHSSSSGRDASRTQSSDSSHKSGADTDIGMLLSAGLAAVLPVDDDYRVRVFNFGWKLDVVTAERMQDWGPYAARRITELRASAQPEALWAADHLAACPNLACVTDFGIRETLGQAVQAAHIAYGANFAEVVVAGRRQVLETAFYTKFQPALFYHAALANRIESNLGRDSAQAGAMPLAERRLQLVKTFYEQPAQDILAALPSDKSIGQLITGQAGTPYQVQFEGKTYTANDRGIFIYGGGAVVFGGGVAGGVKYSFTDSASGSKSASTSTKTSSSSSKRSTTND